VNAFPKLRRPPGPYVFFGLAALSIMMFSIDGTIVSVALPTIVTDLDTTLALTSWTITAYALTQTVMMPLAGKLAEQFGRMRVFLVCVILFTTGSLLCGLAPNIYALIFFRIIQAIGGGGFLPTAVGIVAKEFPENRNRMIGLFASIFPIGGIIGPNLGGFIVEHVAWRYVFLVNVPIGLLVLGILLRRVRQPEEMKRSSIDFLGAFFFVGAMLALMSALTFLGRDPTYWQTPQFWILMLGSAASLVAFIRQELRAEEPVLDLGLVLRHPFGAINLYNFVFGACVFGMFTFIPYFAYVQFQMGPSQSGAVLTPRSLAMMATATFTSLVLIRLGYRAPMIGGMVLIITSLLLLGAGPSDLTIGSLYVSPFWLMAIEVAMSGVGMGLAIPSSNNAALDLAPDRVSTLTGIRGMFRSTGGFLGTALIVLALELSPDKAVGLRNVFVVLGILLVFTIPLTLSMPDLARDRRKEPPDPSEASSAGGAGAAQTAAARSR
jgi:EmrB/QacA subfamily drug resistance transporter